MMKMGKQLIPFRTSKDLFQDEKSGIKNNTARVYDKAAGFDWRFEELRNQALSGKYTHIKITNFTNRKEKFTRKIMHIAHMFNYPPTPKKQYELFVITWKPSKRK